MRLDKFLKVSRLIKRRSVANEICSSGRVSVNGRPAKPGAEIKPGDILEITFGQGRSRVQVREVRETVRKEQAQELYEILDSGQADTLN